MTNQFGFKFGDIVFSPYSYLSDRYIYVVADETLWLDKFGKTRCSFFEVLLSKKQHTLLYLPTVTSIWIDEEFSKEIKPMREKLTKFLKMEKIC